MTRLEFKERYGNDIRHCFYTNFPWLPVIVAKENRNAITYCNESKTPNCILSKYWLTTTCDIPPNTEITLSYNKRYPRDYTL